VNHHVEAFLEDGGGWGWQCFTCGAEAEGFHHLYDAEDAMDEHATDQEEEDS
jgi:hypothetical protein